MTEHEIEYDDALNQAGWAMIEKLGKMDIAVSGPLFNGIKQALRPAIAAYLNAQQTNVEQS